MEFVLYYIFSTILNIILFLFIYRFYVKKKCTIFSDIADKQIDDYFKAYDTDFENLTDTLNDMSKDSQDPTKF